ncbi:MAG: glycosyltransferase family 9 protein, partial [Chitinispirillaceae bacterium]|nr:glycosyltransferase family 9 protein [Chitinispirillaceae bacterium]
MKKILIIRFSSIGDIIQCMSAIGILKEIYPEIEIHWVTRKDMAPILTIDTRIKKIWSYDRQSGFVGLVKLFLRLKKEKFTYLYDAHNNIRSSILKFLFFLSNPSLFLKRKVITRSKERIKRFLLFSLHINLFPKPFVGSYSYVKPLLSLGEINSIKIGNKISFDFFYFPHETKEKVNSLLKPVNGKKWICIAPSAAWELKKWPIEYWIELIKLLPELHFVIIGGPEDYFCDRIANVDRNRIINLAGSTSIIESIYVVYKAEIFISGDTGFLHATDFFKKKGVALIGPTAFGYPASSTIKVLEVKMKCKPCSKDGRGRCRNKEYKKCMREIRPEEVKKVIEALLY